MRFIAPSCYYGKDSAHLITGEKRRIEDLKMGDRVFSIDPSTHELIEDEIVLMMHNEPNQTGKNENYMNVFRTIIPYFLAVFYQFHTVDGYQVSLTGAHNIPIYDPVEERVRIVRSQDVKLRDQLIMQGRKIGLRNITTHYERGFYSPLTLSSYLMVNDILTHVFSDK